MAMVDDARTQAVAAAAAPPRRSYRLSRVPRIDYSGTSREPKQKQQKRSPRLRREYLADRKRENENLKAQATRIEAVISKELLLTAAVDDADAADRDNNQVALENVKEQLRELEAERRKLEADAAKAARDEKGEEEMDVETYEKALPPVLRLQLLEIQTTVAASSRKRVRAP
jgi:hypothetical protein